MLIESMTKAATVEKYEYLKNQKCYIMKLAILSDMLYNEN